jgi:hypothetical protein
MKKNEIVFSQRGEPNSGGLPVSSYIKSISDLEGELLVEFFSGDKFAYDVSSIGGIDSVFDILKRGRVTMTIGQVFHRYIKGAGVPYRRVV